MTIAMGTAALNPKPYRRSFLKNYYNKFSKDNLSELWDDRVAEVLEQQGFQLPSTPRSVYKVEKLYSALNKYSPEVRPRVKMSDIHVRHGLTLARQCFARPGDQPLLDLEEFTPSFIYSITSNKKGSSGLTAWGQTKAESYVRAYERGVQTIKGLKSPEPCIAFARTQFNDKTRLVWGFPYSMTAIEGLFARPLIERFLNGNTPMAFGMSTGALGSKIRVSSRHKTYAYSTDISSFDSSIASELIHHGFDVLSTWFDLTKTEPTTGVQYSEIWKMIERYFITCPIVMPDQHIYTGRRHGVPSGSYFTQLIDSIVNVIMLGALDSKFHMGIEREDIYVLGDDLLFWSNNSVDLQYIAKYISDTFSVTCSPLKSSKTRFDQPVHYLGRDWNIGMPTLNEEEILARMVNPERFRRYSDDHDTATRQVHLLLQSYASVYLNAYDILVRSSYKVRRGIIPHSSLEWNAIRGIDPSYSEDFHTGLVRYLRRYIYDRSYSHKPLALQFWK